MSSSTSLMQLTRELKAMGAQVAELKRIYGKQSLATGLNKLLLCGVFSFLGPRDARRALVVCRAWNVALESRTGQLLLLKICYPYPRIELAATRPREELFKALTRLDRNWADPDFDGTQSRFSPFFVWPFKGDTSKVGFHSFLLGEPVSWAFPDENRSWMKQFDFGTGNLLFQCGEDGKQVISVLDKTGEIKRVHIPGQYNEGSFAVGEGLVAWSWDGTIRIYDLSTGQRWSIEAGFDSARVRSVSRTMVVYGMSGSSYVAEVCVVWLFNQQARRWERLTLKGRNIIAADVFGRRIVTEGIIWADPDDRKLALWSIDSETCSARRLYDLCANRSHFKYRVVLDQSGVEISEYSDLNNEPSRIVSSKGALDSLVTNGSAKQQTKNKRQRVE